MKKFIRIFLPIIILIVFSYMGYHIVQASQNKKIREERIAHIPIFELKTLQEGIFTNKNLKQNVSVVFLYFNSECDFCQAETEEIISNIKKLEDIQVFFVSNEPIKQIIEFQQKYKLDDYNNVMFLCDYENKFSELFGVKTIPTSFIYSKEGVLLYKNDGPVKIEYLLKSIK